MSRELANEGKYEGNITEVAAHEGTQYWFARFRIETDDGQEFFTYQQGSAALIMSFIKMIELPRRVSFEVKHVEVQDKAFQDVRIIYR